MNELDEMLRITAVAEKTLEESRQWRVMRRRIKDDYIASKKHRKRLQEKEPACGEGYSYNMASKSCEALKEHPSITEYGEMAHEMSERANKKNSPLMHVRASRHHGKAAMESYKKGFIDRAKMHEKKATWHRKQADRYLVSAVED